MTEDEIFDAARQSHLDVYALGRDKLQFIYRLKAFANLVSEHERKECLKLADSLGWVNVDHIQSRGQA